MLKVIELFGGIGSPRKALERLKIGFKVVDYVEIDKFAVKSYNAMYGENFEPQDICKWDKQLECDLIFHGSPCQDFSIAGKQAGADEDSGTRSSLMYETIRIVKKIRPKYVIWENVPNVLSAKHRHNFEKYLEQMKELGYTNYYEKLNAKDYGIPQNRLRVFTISILGEHKPFIFPSKQELKLRLKDMLEDEVNEKYYLSDKMINYVMSGGTKEFYCEPKLNTEIAKPLLATMTKMHRAGIDNYITDNIHIIGKLEVNGWQDHMKRVYNTVGISPTISTMQGGNRQPKIIEKEQINYRIRKLTPLECWRLMGFDDVDFEKASQVCSNSQLYKQAGNSICVPVLENILKELLK